MNYVLGIVLSAVWYVAGYRIIGWFRTLAADQRKRLEAAGYAENNPGRRLRGDKYVRVASLVFVIVHGLAWAAIYASTPMFMPFLGKFILCAVFSPLIGFIPAMSTWHVLKFIAEWKEPLGDVYLDRREKQFHIVGKPIEAKGQLGVSVIIDAVTEGFTNPAALSVPRRAIATVAVAK
jgi:hypothetical protein